VRTRALIITGISALMISAVSPVRSQEPTTQPSPGTTQPALDAKLEAIDARAAEIKDLVADFEQRKYSALLREPLVTKGEIRATRSSMLWRGETPEPTRMRVTLERMQIYYVKQNLIEDYPIVGKLGSLAASPLPRLATLRERFTLTADDGNGLAVPASITDGVFIRLTPIEDEVKQYVDSIRVLLDPARGLVMTFELTDPDGERTTIAFSNVRANVGIDAAALELDAPRNVKIVKPLEPGRST
jgi:hypothetical protein